jgi:hypothetical protein
MVECIFAPFLHRVLPPPAILTQTSTQAPDLSSSSPPLPPPPNLSAPAQYDPNSSSSTTLPDLSATSQQYADPSTSSPLPDLAAPDLNLSSSSPPLPDLSPAQLDPDFSSSSPPALRSTPSTQLFHPPVPTHANRDTQHFVQPLRHRERPSDAQKASRKIREEANDVNQKALNEELTALLLKHRQELTDLADRHARKIAYIDRLVGTSKHYKAPRAVNMENAKLHAKASEINGGQSLCLSVLTLFSSSFPTDREFGDRVKLSELRQMVRDDPALQDLTEEQENELREDVMAVREQRKLGARPTNKSAAQDYRNQVDSLNDQVSSV